MILTLNKTSKNYPKLLKKIPDIPENLYIKGAFNKDIFENCLAVVGSRRMTAYGYEVTKKIVSSVSSFGVTVVSGFMYGIDATAHETAVASGGKTIAIMPCGINLICPPHQDALYEKIIETGGLIVSEFEEDITPKNWMFPRRNRIVAGMCMGVLVAEAALNSGSLITANYALAYKRKVFVVPGNITSKNSEGIMELISKGAIPVSKGSDIVQHILPRDAIKKQAKDKAVSQSLSDSAVDVLTDVIEKKIMQELSYEPKTFDSLLHTVSVTSGKLDYKIMQLTLKGLVKNSGGRLYACKS